MHQEVPSSIYLKRESIRRTFCRLLVLLKLFKNIASSIAFYSTATPSDSSVDLGVEQTRALIISPYEWLITFYSSRIKSSAKPTMP